jgi:membrane associated rhomboid family serine protease
MSYTIIIVAITCIISLVGFTNESVVNKLILWPRKMDNPMEYYRLLTSGFIHADWMHLAFNMYALYIFGSNVQMIFGYLGIQSELYVMLYLTGIIVASLPSFLKNRHNAYYRSLGASGGVASIIFFTIYYFPWSRIGIFPIPFNIYAIVFGGLYLAYEAFMARRGMGNVNHDAHFWGSVYGLFFAFLLDPTHGKGFIDTIMHPQ